MSYDSAVVRAMTLPSAGRLLGVGARSPTGKREASEFKLSEGVDDRLGDGCLWWPFAFFALCFWGLWRAGGGVRSVDCCGWGVGERVELGRTAAEKRGGSKLGGLEPVSQRVHCLAGAARSMLRFKRSETVAREEESLSCRLSCSAVTLESGRREREMPKLSHSGQQKPVQGKPYARRRDEQQQQPAGSDRKPYTPRPRKPGQSEQPKRHAKVDGAAQATKPQKSQQLDLSGQQLTQLPRLADYAALSKLNLSNCGLTEITFVKDAAQSLTWLNVSGNDLSRDRAWNGVESLSTLFGAYHQGPPYLPSHAAKANTFLVAQS